MNWKKKTVFTSILCLGLCALFLPNELEVKVTSHSELEYQEETTEVSPRQVENNQRLPSSLGPLDEKQELGIIELNELDKVFQEKYLSNENAEILQEKTEDLFRHSKFKKQISRWVVMGLYMSNDIEFIELMQENLQNLKANSPQILEDILDIKEEISKDPFIEQATLSIVSNLDLKGDDKAEYFQGVISRELWFDSDGVDTSSLNVSTALAFLKQEDVSPQKLNEILSMALNVNSENEESFDEILTRLSAYYPSQIEAMSSAQKYD